MNGSKRRGAFTLIEVLIVVVIMAVLAATIIPQFTSSTKDAKESTAKFNLNTLRSQVELYKLHHNGTLPDGLVNLQQLTKPTNVSGVTGAAGTSFPFGPYIQKIPNNPFTGGNKVTPDNGAAGSGIPAATGAADAGWIYRKATGEFWLDHEDYIGLPEYQ